MVFGIDLVRDTIRSLWRGEVPLGQVVLVYAILIPIILGIPINLQQLTVGINASSSFNAVFLPLYSLFLVSYVIFVSICVWRSATNFKGRVIWPFVAKVSIVLMMLIVAASFAFGLFIGVPQARF